MLELYRVSKAYAKGAVKAVDDLSLTVHKGEIFGFIGPNGAGKTTTIKMICGIINPDAGRVTVGGFDIAAQPLAAKRSMGFVPDASNVFDRLTGLEYLNFLADVYGVDADTRRERMEKYLTMFEIKDAAASLIKSYSHGMRQKLTITGALLHRPPLWILDEPLTGLDPRAAHQLKQEMRSHCDAGNTVFFSTHVLEVAERLCDRIGIISKGRLLAVGTLEELRAGERGESLEDLFLEMTGQDGEAMA
ncbi:MAG: ABC transporter ATP-binding protein [Firmicutes bacterium]|nr:ABC transporter ATP-binding protein [Bacillota bacterium]